MSNLLRRSSQSVLVTALLMTVMLASAITQVQAATCGADPTVNFASTAMDVLPDGSVDYAVSITNVTGSVCNFILTTSGDSPGFTSSLPDGSPFSVGAGATEVTTLKVAVSGVPLGGSNTTTLSIDGLLVVDYTVDTTVNNPLLHNSFNLNSNKWTSEGGWGVAGGKYGESDCRVSVVHCRSLQG